MARDALGLGRRLWRADKRPTWRAVVIDYGVKRNILRLLAGHGADITVVPANATLDDVMRHEPMACCCPTVPAIRPRPANMRSPPSQALVDRGVPVFGICLGHQMLGLALGAKTRKMAQGHHGANHPVKDLETGKVEIVSMNHGFTVDSATPARRA